jgi:hypothetical protein
MFINWIKGSGNLLSFQYSDGSESLGNEAL